MSPELITFGKYLAGEFDNQKQALAEPVWYVHLHLWLRPVSLFTEDSLVLFAEQASIVKLEQSYRPRLLRLRQNEANLLEVQHYMFNDMRSVQGAGSHPELLKHITLDQLTFLPSCTLSVTVEQLSTQSYRFQAFPKSAEPCSFTYQGNTYQVSLGLEVTAEELKTYDKGIEPSTGKAIWGALMGPYRYTKRQDFSQEFLV